MEIMQDQAVLDRQPKSSDPLEIEIRKRLEDSLESTNWAKSTFHKFRQIQAVFFKFALDHLSEPESIKVREKELVNELASDGKTKIIQGEENLNGIDPNKGLIL